MLAAALRGLGVLVLSPDCLGLPLLDAGFVGVFFRSRGLYSLFTVIFGVWV
jgi:hypothetical protein